MQGFHIIKTAKAFFKGIYNMEFLRAKGISRIALYECLACLDANSSHASMRMSRMPRCETLEIPVFSCLFILPPTLKKVIFFVILANILLINKEV